MRGDASGSSRSRRSPPGGGKGSGVGADADEGEEFVVFEGARAGALEARERLAQGRSDLGA